MRAILMIALVIIFLGCSNGDPQEMKAALGGYWVIEKVELADGSSREFRPGTTIDYFEVTGDSGVRKKVVPRIDGRFEVNKSAERFYLKVENDSLNIYYKTPYNEWKETVLRAKDSNLVIINSENKRYYYKKFRSFDLNE